jgi:hypothetical protein
MCFGGEFLFWLVLRVIFIIFVLTLARIWLLPWISQPRPDGQPADPRLIMTLNAVIWLMWACFVVYLIWIVYQCMFSGPGIGMGIGPSRLR